MSMLRETFARIAGFFGRRRALEENLEAELRAHLALAAEEKVRAGMSPEEARLAARRDFGGLEQAKEKYREQRGLPFADTLVNDLRYGFRMLRKARGFTFVAILTLAIGIGANTAIFSVVHAVLLAPFPYPNAERLAIVWSVYGLEGRAPAAGPELTYLQERSKLFEEFGGIWAQSGALTGEREPEQVKVGQVTWNFLSMLSAKPQVGRFFRPEEQRFSAARSMILSDALWRRRFGGDSQVIGKPVRMNGNSFTIVGVMPANFRIIFPEGSSVPPEMDAYIPFPADLAAQPADQGYIRVIGRLKRGVMPQQAQSEADQMASQMRTQFPAFAEQELKLQVVPLHGDVVRNLRPALLALFSGVGFVLLIACANVANLLLSRASQRQREMTLRIAMGATRGRVIRQLLTESVLLSCIGGAAAVLVGAWALKLLLVLRPQEMERLGTIELDFTAFGFTLALSLIAGVSCGVAPALRATCVNLVESLKESGRNVAGARHDSRSALIVCEVALGFVLLIGAGLMMQTFARLLRVNPGFAADGLLTFHVSAASAKYETPESATEFFRKLQKNVAAVPEVESVGVVSHLPFDESLPNWYSYYWAEGAPKQEQNTVMADHRSVFPGYFKSIGASFVAGRDFDDFDIKEGREVVIVDEVVAQRAWPDGVAVGRKLNIEHKVSTFESGRGGVEVIGVVKHVHSHSLMDRVRGQVYLPYPQAVRPHMSLTVRSKAAPETLVPLLLAEVAKLDKDLPIYNVQPMSAYVEKARRETRFTTTLSGALALIALLLACTGIYGVTSYSVQRRTNELGTRIALGAQRSDIFAMVLREGMWPVAVGLTVGLALSFALTPLIAGLLFGVRASDPLTLAGSGIFLGAVGLLACYLPARRAVRVDPLVALRYE